MERQSQATRQRHDRLMDRWIDLIAASYGMPRIVLLRELETPLHLAREVARVVAANQASQGDAPAPVGAVALAPTHRTAETDAETDAFLAKLRAEMHGEPGA